MKEKDLRQFKDYNYKSFRVHSDKMTIKQNMSIKQKNRDR